MMETRNLCETPQQLVTPPMVQRRRTNHLGRSLSLFCPRMFSVWVIALTLMTALPFVTAQPCECNDCTQDILNTDARGQTCGQRIAEQRQEGLSATEACTVVAQAYPWDCGPFCHPSKCDGQAPPVCDCFQKLDSAACTEEVWGRVADGFTCGQRILLVLNGFGETAACRQVAENYPEICGACHPLECSEVSSQPSMSPSSVPTERNIPTQTQSTYSKGWSMFLILVATLLLLYSLHRL